MICHCDKTYDLLHLLDENLQKLRKKVTHFHLYSHIQISTLVHYDTAEVWSVEKFQWLREDRKDKDKYLNSILYSAPLTWGLLARKPEHSLLVQFWVDVGADTWLTFLHPGCLSVPGWQSWTWSRQWRENTTVLLVRVPPLLDTTLLVMLVQAARLSWPELSVFA